MLRENIISSAIEVITSVSTASTVALTGWLLVVLKIPKQPEWLAWIVLAVTLICTVGVGVHLVKLVCDYYLQEKRKKRALKYLETLSDSEIEALSTSVESNARNLDIGPNDSAGQFLAFKGIVSKAPVEENARFTVYVINDFIWETIRHSPRREDFLRRATESRTEREQQNKRALEAMRPRSRGF